MLFGFLERAAAQQYLVFIGSYNKSKAKKGVYVYVLDTASGGLTKITSVRGVYHPSFITLSPDGSHVYACTESLTPGKGSVSSFAFDREKGTLSFVNSQRSGGENPVYLVVDKTGKWLVNGNYTEGSVSVYPLGTDGSIKAAVQVIPFAEGSVNEERQERAHIHATVFSPDGQYLFLPDLGADKIRSFCFNPATDKPLQPAGQSFVAAVPGSGPRHFVFHPGGKFAFCIEELSGTITSYRYQNGKLDSMQRIAAHTEQKESYSSADIHISPDGLFLYASNRGDENNIAIFSIDTTDGKLTNIGYQSTMGGHPRNFAIDPGGKYLLVANQFSGNVVVFKRSAQTGLLTDTGVRIKIPGASCLQIRKY